MRWTTLSFAPSSYRFDAIPRLNPCQPYHFEPQSFYGRTGYDVLAQLVEIHVLTCPRSEISHRIAGPPWRDDTHSGISASCRMTGHRWALARVFGRFTTLFHIDLLTGERVAGEIRPFKPAQFSFASPAKDGRSDSLLWTTTAERSESNVSGSNYMQTFRALLVRF